jgi:threonine dehydrogenase-like Zn-dependent dehydrogenase
MGKRCATRSSPVAPAGSSLAGQCHVQRYLKPLYERILNGEIDPSFVVTHRLPLSEAPNAFETFKHKQDDCVKVVLQP